MDVDMKGHRLFVAALGNDTVEVIDLTAGKRTGTITGLSEPQGLVYMPEFNRIVIANGGDGTVGFYDATTLRKLHTTALGDDADNMRYDPARRRVYVGYGNGAIGVLDAATGKKVAAFKLPGHPESFQLEAGGSRIFVNVPTARQVAVIDRVKAAVVATWPLKQAQSNFPMALDEGNGRLFVGCRWPAKLLVLDTRTGKVVATTACPGDVDDIYYDAASRRLYLSGGSGALDVFQQTDADHYRLISQTPTAPGARTSLLVAAWKSMYVAVPRRGGRSAEIRSYKLP